MTAQTKRFINRIYWEKGHGGWLSTPGKHDLPVLTPPESEGHEGVWTPEDLFAAAFNSCFMTRFLRVAAWKGLEFLSFECEVEGLLERKEKGFVFMEVELRPRVVLPEGANEALALRALHTAKKDCAMSNPVETEVVMKAEVVAESPVLEAA